jgi:hypothetical protein
MDRYKDAEGDYEAGIASLRYSFRFPMSLMATYNMNDIPVCRTASVVRMKRSTVSTTVEANVGRVNDTEEAVDPELWKAQNIVPQRQDLFSSGPAV